MTLLGLSMLLEKMLLSLPLATRQYDPSLLPE